MGEGCRMSELRSDDMGDVAFWVGGCAVWLNLGALRQRFRKISAPRYAHHDYHIAMANNTATTLLRTIWRVHT